MFKACLWSRCSCLYFAGKYSHASLQVLSNEADSFGGERRLGAFQAKMLMGVSIWHMRVNYNPATC